MHIDLEITKYIPLGNAIFICILLEELLRERADRGFVREIARGIVREIAKGIVASF